MNHRAPRARGWLPLLAATALGAKLSYFDANLPTSMNPLFAMTDVDSRVADLVFDRLVYASPINQEPKSALLEVDAHGSIRAEYAAANTIQLFVKPGLTWHDGEPVTATDVCFTVDALLNEGTPSRAGVQLRTVVDHCVVAPDALSFAITFRKVLRDPLAHLGFYVLPAHAFPQGTAVSPDLDFSSRPIGSGPMSAARGRRGVRFVAYDNPHHHAAIRELAEVDGGDPFVMERTLLSGAVSGWLDVPVALRADIVASDVATLYHTSATGFAYLALDTRTGALADVRVRQAIDLSLDRTVLREVTAGAHLPNGLPELVSGPFPRSSPYYAEQVPVRDHADLAQATDLLRSAGAESRGGRWVWRDEALTLRIGVSPEVGGASSDMARQLQNELEQAGFSTELRALTYDEWSASVVTGRVEGVNALLGTWTLATKPDAGADALFHERTRDGHGMFNLFGWSDPAANKLIEGFGAAATDIEARDQLRGLHALLAEQLPYVFLWATDDVSAWRNEVRGVAPAPQHEFWNFDAWTVAPP